MSEVIMHEGIVEGPPPVDPYEFYRDWKAVLRLNPDLRGKPVEGSGFDSDTFHGQTHYPTGPTEISRLYGGYPTKATLINWQKKPEFKNDVIERYNEIILEVMDSTMPQVLHAAITRAVHDGSDQSIRTALMKHAEVQAQVTEANSRRYRIDNELDEEAADIAALAESLQKKRAQRLALQQDDEFVPESNSRRVEKREVGQFLKDLNG